MGGRRLVHPLTRAAAQHRKPHTLYVSGHLHHRVVRRRQSRQAADYMGTVLVNGHPAGPSPLLIAGLGMALLSFTLVIRSAHHARRWPREMRAHRGTGPVMSRVGWWGHQGAAVTSPGRAHRAQLQHDVPVPPLDAVPARTSANDPWAPADQSKRRWIEGRPRGDADRRCDAECRVRSGRTRAVPPFWSPGPVCLHIFSIAPGGSSCAAPGGWLVQPPNKVGSVRLLGQGVQRPLASGPVRKKSRHERHPGTRPGRG
jgi:hypothetical protein